jgi:ParB family chromosome partitioning protein
MTKTKTLQFNYPSACTLVHPEDIIIKGRARKDFGNLEELADSIVRVGLIHPPALEGSNILIGGERRIKAMQLLGAEVIPVLFRENMTSYEIKEAELHENTQRLKMKWQEKVMLIHDAHRLREHENALQGKPWYQKDTGALFGQSNASVHNALQLASYITDGDTEILETNEITQALQILLDRAEQAAMAEQVKRHGTQVPHPTKSADHITVIDTETGIEVASILPKTPDTPTVPQPSFQSTEFDLSTMCKFGDCLKIMKSMQPGSVDHVLTDIPYGVDVNQMDITDKDKVEAEHDVQQNLEMMPKFLQLSYDLIGTKGGFCVFFFDLEHFEKLRDEATRIGYKVTAWPYHWIKTHQCQNKSAQFNFTKCVEHAMVCRRGSQTTLLKPWPKNYIMADGATERKMYYTHAFAKPSAAWNDILEHIAFVGQTILDPFAGQFSSGRAMLNKGIKPVMIELSQYHFVRGVELLMEQINKITNNQATFVNNPLENMS